MSCPVCTYKQGDAKHCPPRDPPISAPSLADVQRWSEALKKMPREPIYVRAR